MSAAPLWVLLVSWNSRDDILRCLTALEQQTVPPCRVLVVDNGSADGTASAVRASFPAVGLFALAHNHGFARAVNIGLRYALERDAALVLLLNADTRFAPDFLGDLMAAVAHRPRLGAASPKVYLEGAEGRLWGIGGILERDGLRFYGLGEMDTGQHDTRPLDFVLGCAMLIRTEALRAAGLLDERFFVFFEEIDLCLRIQTLGWGIELLPELQILHTGGASTARRQYIRQFYLGRSRMAFLRKHAARFSLPRLALAETIFARKTVVGCLLQGDPRAALAYLRGVAAGLLGQNAAALRQPL